MYYAKIIKTILGNWKWCTNYSTNRMGRNWVSWDPSKVEFIVEVIHNQYIQGFAKIRKLNMEFTLWATYSTRQERLWVEIRGIAANMSGPNILMSDYNIVLDIENIIKGTPIPEREVKDFKEFI